MKKPAPLSKTLVAATRALKKGGMVILVDDEKRENEGDLILAAEFITPEKVNFLLHHARGLICLSLEASRIDELRLPPMAPRNESPRKTAFTVSIEAKDGVTTGISTADRARTIQVASDPQYTARDLITPGHIFPLRAEPGGVLVRAGHTEGALDLVKLAGLRPAAVICEILNADGTMSRMPDLRAFSKRHGIPIVRMEELLHQRWNAEKLVEPIARAKFPSRVSEKGLELRAFKSLVDGSEHVALTTPVLKDGALVRIHSECLTGDALGSSRCDCGEQLQRSIARVAESGNGAVLYLRNHEGRGIGLGNKVRAYALQDQGFDTVEANHELGFEADLRSYGIAAQMVRALGLRKIHLLTNNPVKMRELESCGIEVLSRVELEIEPNASNERYLATKRDKLGHRLVLTKKPAKKSSRARARKEDA